MTQELEPTSDAQFQSHVEKQWAELVENNIHPHPKFLPTRINQTAIDLSRREAVCILFEQIDWDAYTGDQLRYSIWAIIDEMKARRIYEDHAYENGGAASGYRGRDCSIWGLELGEGIIQVKNADGDILKFNTNDK